MLDVEELLELEDNIRKELDDHLPAALSMLNRTGELETFLKMLGMEDLLQSKPLYKVYKTGKIIVIGRSDVKAEVLLSHVLQTALPTTQKCKPVIHSSTTPGGYEENRTPSFFHS